jgi:hypothetical protein
VLQQASHFCSIILRTQAFSLWEHGKMQLQCDVPMGMVPHRSKPCRLQSFEHASHHIDICEHGEAELQSASMCPWALVWAALGEPCRLSMPASLWDVCARGGATVCDVRAVCGHRSHVILQTGSSTGRRCEWVGSCPTSLVGVGSARAPSSRSARAATALAARSMRRSAATRGSEDALLSLYIKSGPGLYTHASGPGHPQAWAGRSGEAWGEDTRHTR